MFSARPQVKCRNVKKLTYLPFRSYDSKVMMQIMIDTIIESALVRVSTVNRIVPKVDYEIEKFTTLRKG